MNRYKEFQLELLRNKTKQYTNENIIKLKSHNELLFALKRKYRIFFSIIENNGMQYKQFLSGFFNCILQDKEEPFYIRIKITK